MTLMGRIRSMFGGEVRSLENPAIAVSDDAAWATFFRDGYNVSEGSGVYVTAETALAIPAYWSGVNFMADTLASLPLQVFKRKGDAGRVLADTDSAYSLLHAAASEDVTAFDLRKSLWVSFYTRGVAYAYIERNAAGEPLALFRMPASLTRRQILPNGRRVYHFASGNTSRAYEARDVIDLAWMMAENGIDHIDPVAKFRGMLGNAVATERFSGRHFAAGGMVPYVLEGPFQSAGAAQRAKQDLDRVLQQQAQDRSAPFVALPIGHTVKTIGSTPIQSQMVELQKFIVGQVARFFGLPPAALQDYSDSKYTTAEQQDLAIVKHAVRPRVVQFEQAINLRLFVPRWGAKRYCEHNVDALLRGDFKTRVEGIVSMVRNGVMTPNEARSLFNIEAQAEGNKLMVESQLVALENAIVAAPAASQGVSA